MTVGQPLCLSPLKKTSLAFDQRAKGEGSDGPIARDCVPMIASGVVSETWRTDFWPFAYSQL